MKRAYSLLTIKAVDEDKRIITGIATTPETDRMGDIVESDGAEFKLPIPLLWQHDSDQPIGHVIKAKITKAGIEVTAQIAMMDEPGTLKDRLDEAWQSVKTGLVRGLSIGFSALETARIEGTYGLRFIKWLWLELSCVTIPANGSASIQTVKSIDAQLRAVSGRKGIESNPSAVAAPVKLLPKEGKTVKKSIAEQISAFEATRGTKSARMDAIMDEAAEKGETLAVDQKEEYDTLAGEVKELDDHLVRLRVREKSAAVLSSAKAVDGNDPDGGSRSRESHVVQVRNPKLIPGTAFVRMVGALAQANGNRHVAAEIAKQWDNTTPEVSSVLRMPNDIIQRTAVNPGTTTDTTWASPLVQYQNLASEFIDYLRPLTIIGRINGFRRVPFKVKVPRQTGGASVNWVGEGKVKPLTSLAFDSITLDPAKIAGIIPLSEELVRFSSPSAEMLVRDDLAAAITQFMDSEFIDPTNAATDVSPASVTYGVTPITATGTTAAAFRADAKAMFAALLVANQQIRGGTWVMTQQQAVAFSLMTSSLGTPLYPGITPEGGTLLGFPVVVSENVPSAAGSPADGYYIVFVLPGEILLADDGAVTIDVSREASLQMDTSPDSPGTASTVLVSLWQQNLIGIKAERFINWKARRTTAAGVIAGAKYAE